MSVAYKPGKLVAGDRGRVDLHGSRDRSATFTYMKGRYVMNLRIKARLGLMMFLEYIVWGTWWMCPA
ncbi:MAG TPA: hypothetical protein VK638_20980 [Edaphobacter sp.]|nr:hypothetical protein [Edaphobacter sp.]